ncbi:hypothetical protein MKFW12EY_42720 [Methylomonas koyamae]|nr:hypothetical protein MKFW12EY_42720 [Methylomonas koyamae]
MNSFAACGADHFDYLANGFWEGGRAAGAGLELRSGMRVLAHVPPAARRR